MNVALIPSQFLTTAYASSVHQTERDITRTNILPEEKVVPLISQTRYAEIEDLKFAKRNLLLFDKSLYDGLRFTVDKRSGKNVIQVIDREVGQIVRQISTTEMFAHRFQGNVVGYFLDSIA